MATHPCYHGNSPMLLVPACHDSYVACNDGAIFCQMRKRMIPPNRMNHPFRSTKANPKCCGGTQGCGEHHTAPQRGCGGEERHWREPYMKALVTTSDVIMSEWVHEFDWSTSACLCMQVYMCIHTYVRMYACTYRIAWNVYEALNFAVCSFGGNPQTLYLLKVCRAS